MEWNGVVRQEGRSGVFGVEGDLGGLGVRSRSWSSSLSITELLHTTYSSLVTTQCLALYATTKSTDPTSLPSSAVPNIQCTTTSVSVPSKCTVPHANLPCISASHVSARTILRRRACRARSPHASQPNIQPPPKQVPIAMKVTPNDCMWLNRHTPAVKFHRRMLPALPPPPSMNSNTWKTGRVHRDLTQGQLNGLVRSPSKALLLPPLQPPPE